MPERDRGHTRTTTTDEPTRQHTAGLRDLDGHGTARQVYHLLGCEYPGANPDTVPEPPSGTATATFRARFRLTATAGGGR